MALTSGEKALVLMALKDVVTVPDCTCESCARNIAARRLVENL